MFYKGVEVDLIEANFPNWGSEIVIGRRVRVQYRLSSLYCILNNPKCTNQMKIATTCVLYITNKALFDDLTCKHLNEFASLYTWMWSPTNKQVYHESWYNLVGCTHLCNSLYSSRKQYWIDFYGCVRSVPVWICSSVVKCFNIVTLVSAHYVRVYG